MGPFPGDWDSADNWYDENARFIIPSSLIQVSAHKVRIILGWYDADWSFDHLYMGHVANSGDPYDFSGDQVEVTFSGGSGGTVTNTGLMSDEITFNLNKNKNLIFAFFFSASQATPKKSTETGYDLWYKFGVDESSVTDVSDYVHPPDYYMQRFIVFIDSVGESPSISPSPSPSRSPSNSPSLSPSASQSPSSSPSLSPSASESPSQSPSKSPSESPSSSPSLSPSASESPSRSPSESPSLSPSASISPSQSPSASPSIGSSPSLSPSQSPSISPSASQSPSQSPSKSPSESQSISPSISPSASLSPSVSPSMSPSLSPSPSVSLETDEGLNPQVMLSWSNDGGYTWSNEIHREIPRIGQHKKTVYWDRLGRARDRVFKVAISDPVKVILVDSFITADEGQN